MYVLCRYAAYLANAGTQIEIDRYMKCVYISKYGLGVLFAACGKMSYLLWYQEGENNIEFEVLFYL